MTYPEGTYEWAIERHFELVSELARLAEEWEESDDFHRSAQAERDYYATRRAMQVLENEMKFMPHGEPIYSHADLENAGQMTLVTV